MSGEVVGNENRPVLLITVTLNRPLNSWVYLPGRSRKRWPPVANLRLALPMPFPLFGHAHTVHVSVASLQNLPLSVASFLVFADHPGEHLCTSSNFGFNMVRLD